MTDKEYNISTEHIKLIMKTTVTLYRYFYKKVTIEIDPDATKGLTKEEIADALMEETIVFDDEQVHDAPIESLEESPKDEETDRFDIYNEKSEHIYGGHL